MGSTNFTFEATIDSSNDEGEGYVGSLDEQQPIEVIIDSSNGVTFQDVSVKSTNGENIFPWITLFSMFLYFCVQHRWRYLAEQGEICWKV